MKVKDDGVTPTPRRLSRSWRGGGFVFGGGERVGNSPVKVVVRMETLIVGRC